MKRERAEEDEASRKERELMEQVPSRWRARLEPRRSAQHTTSPLPAVASSPPLELAHLPRVCITATLALPPLSTHATLPDAPPLFTNAPLHQRFKLAPADITKPPPHTFTRAQPTCVRTCQKSCTLATPPVERAHQKARLTGGAETAEVVESTELLRDNPEVRDVRPRTAP
eukprot:7762301-Pyramimonas_sp.AAC.2